MEGVKVVRKKATVKKNKKAPEDELTAYRRSEGQGYSIGDLKCNEAPISHQKDRDLLLAS